MNYNINKTELQRIAKINNYSATNIEKVLRLCSVLSDLNTQDVTNGKFALKGGTAINLVAFEHIPRLSVDLDFNFAFNISKEEMLVERKLINDTLNEYFKENDYEISYRNTFTLDFISLKYKTLTGSYDKIKLDINYQNRCHIFDSIEKTIPIPFLANNSFVKVKSLNYVELFAGKIKAFYERCKPRDIYDIYTIAKSGLIASKEDKDILRKCVYFYGCIGNTNKKPIFGPDVSNILEMPFQDIKTQLLPMLHINSGKYPKDEINHTIIKFLGEIMNPDDNDILFWNSFIEGKYKPELIFNEEIVKNIKNHPVALYNLQNYIDLDIKNRISGIGIYADLGNKNHYVRCCIDKIPQMGIKLDKQDYENYRNKTITKELLREKIFLKAKYAPTTTAYTPIPSNRAVSVPFLSGINSFFRLQLLS